MRWIADAGMRFWQAYREGLEMSCPLHNHMAEAVADRLVMTTPCERDRNHDAAALAAATGSQTVH